METFLKGKKKEKKETYGVSLGNYVAFLSKYYEQVSL